MSSRDICSSYDGQVPLERGRKASVIDCQLTNHPPGLHKHPFLFLSKWFEMFEDVFANDVFCKAKVRKAVMIPRPTPR